MTIGIAFFAALCVFVLSYRSSHDTVDHSTPFILLSIAAALTIISIISGFVAIGRAYKDGQRAADADGHSWNIGTRGLPATKIERIGFRPPQIRPRSLVQAMTGKGQSRDGVRFHAGSLQWVDSGCRPCARISIAAPIGQSTVTRKPDPLQPRAEGLSSRSGPTYRAMLPVLWRHPWLQPVHFPSVRRAELIRRSGKTYGDLLTVIVGQDLAATLRLGVQRPHHLRR